MFVSAFSRGSSACSWAGGFFSDAILDCEGRRRRVWGTGKEVFHNRKGEGRVFMSYAARNKTYICSVWQRVFLSTRGLQGSGHEMTSAMRGKDCPVEFRKSSLGMSRA